MKLDEIVAWYQKKIGTYDKQQWEKTVEQKILDGFSSVQLKTAKLKTELIDVDLVRGSTFPKAKPKQSLLTVIRLAIQRYFLLPLYAQWWVKQTSHNAFALLFTLYMLQMLSWAIYTYNTNRGLENVQNLNRIQTTSTATTSENVTTINTNHDVNSNEEHIVFISDLLIPMVLSLLLSLIHSQIVATNIATGVKVSKRRRFSNANTASTSSGLLGGNNNNNNSSSNNSKLNREPRIRRRKKLVKLRSQELSDSNSALQQQQQQQQQRQSGLRPLTDPGEILVKDCQPSSWMQEQPATAPQRLQQEQQQQQQQKQRKIINSQTFMNNTIINNKKPTNNTGLEQTEQTESNQKQQTYTAIATTTTTTTTTTSLSNNHNNNKMNNIKVQSQINLKATKASTTMPTNRLMTLDLKNTLSSTDVDAVLPSPPPPPSLSSASMSSTSNIDCLVDNNTCTTNIYNVSHKKRNVNWHSPIHNYAIETQEKQQQTSPQTTNSTSTSSNSSSSSSETNTPNANANNKENTQNSNTTSNSSSSSAIHSQLATPIKTVRIDECVQEFYDELVTRAVVDEMFLKESQLPLKANLKQVEQLTTTAAASAAVLAAPIEQRRAIGEDDGFESLNGKSSSGEETNASLLPSTTSSTTLRLRLNVQRADELPISTTTTSKTINANTVYRRKVPLSSESDADKQARRTTVIGVAGEPSQQQQQQQPKKMRTLEDDTTDHTDEDCDDIETVSSPASAGGNNSNYTECTTSATEWLGVTTNSEDCSYSSELENSDDYNKNQQYSDEDGVEMDFAPSTILNPHGSTDRISCTIWEQREIKKAQMSVLEISSCIIDRVESMPETNDYIILGIVFSLLLSFVPTFCRLCEVTIESTDKSELSYWDLPMLLWEKSSFSFYTLFHFAFGQTKWERTILIMSLMQRFCLTMILFMIFAVAERTFKQRFLYAKLFSHLTSSRRARKSNLPHFRLNKVRNIKTWLSVRSYLKKRGPQRSVDVIVSAAFIVTHLLLAFLSVEWLKDSVHLHSHLNLEALMWSSTCGIFLLRFMTLGNKIHHKYRSISVLITEQINLYLQIEQKPKKKDELMVSNSVLKLAADLLKELETPFKVSGLRANPYLFTTIKVVILSALSGVLSEMLGFKLKLLKIKIK